MRKPLIIPEFKGEYFFLSNFYPCHVRMGDDIIYPSAEHAYQAHKIRRSMYPEDWRDRRMRIASAATPALAKRYGRMIHISANWDDDRVCIMREVVTRKFFQDHKLAQLLVETGECELIEGNYWKDEFWGVYNGKGKNMLGIILTNVRAELNRKTDYRVVSGMACYWIQVQGHIIVDAAPIARAWIGEPFHRFREAFPASSIKPLGESEYEIS